MDFNKFKNAMVSGSLSGCLTSIIFQPLEVIRTRLQQPSNLNKGIYCVISETYRNERGIKVFWYGLTPSIFRSVPVVGIYFTSIELFRNLNLNNNHQRYDLIKSFLIGATSRTIADVSMFPLSLVKTHYESDMYKHRSILDAFRTIFNENGLRGLYRGLSPTLIRDINYSGIQYMIYSNLKKYFNSDDRSRTIAMCALLSSTFACFVTQPTDVIRTRMQLQPVKYFSLIQASKKIYYEEGVRSFFVGFIPRSTRRILITVLSWTIFEKMKIKFN